MPPPIITGCGCCTTTVRGCVFAICTCICCWLMICCLSSWNRNKHEHIYPRRRRGSKRPANGGDGLLCDLLLLLLDDALLLALHGAAVELLPGGGRCNLSWNRKAIRGNENPVRAFNRQKSSAESRRAGGAEGGATAAATGAVGTAAAGAGALTRIFIPPRAFCGHEICIMWPLRCHRVNKCENENMLRSLSALCCTEALS